ncbi:MAG: HEAT repeat domain-containing protein [Gammaproteobacteria bacterium]
MRLRARGLRTVGRRSGFRLLWLVPGLMLWNSSVIPAPQAPFRASSDTGLSKSVHIDIHRDMMTLNVTQASWKEVLDEFRRETGIRFHHTVAPQGVVTVSCPSMTFTRALECLLGRDAALILRYPPRGDGPKRSALPTDVWLLGEPGTSRERSSVAVQSQRKEPQQVMSRGPAAARGERFAALMDMTNSEHADARMQALGSLAASSKRNDPAVQETFRAALMDGDAGARAQGVYALAKNGGAEAVNVLRSALGDSDASVRLMAVDSAGTDAEGAALLQDALADRDETVRVFAAMKLKEIEHSAGSAR